MVLLWYIDCCLLFNLKSNAGLNFVMHESVDVWCFQRSTANKSTETLTPHWKWFRNFTRIRRDVGKCVWWNEFWRFTTKQLFVRSLFATFRRRLKGISVYILHFVIVAQTNEFQIITDSYEEQRPMLYTKCTNTSLTQLMTY